MSTSDRGFGSMDDTKQKEIASKGGKASSGNFKNHPTKAAATGKKGSAQLVEAKAKGGQSRLTGHQP